MLVVALLAGETVKGQGARRTRCMVEDRVKFALRGMNRRTVPAVVDCLVGTGDCDNTGAWLRGHARQPNTWRDSGSHKQNCSAEAEADVCW